MWAFMPAQLALPYVPIFEKWAASWQNQQCGRSPSEDSDPPSLIKVFAVRMKKAWIFSYPLSAQRRLLSDWVDAQADLSLRWAHSYSVGFVMRRLKSREEDRKGLLTFINLDFLYFFVFVIRGHFTTLKVIKSNQIGQNLLKMIKAMTPKKHQNICFVNSIHSTTDLTRAESLLITISENNLVSTRHLRPCFVKHKMLENDFSQKTRRNMYLQGIVMH